MSITELDLLEFSTDQIDILNLELDKTIFKFVSVSNNFFKELKSGEIYNKKTREDKR